MNNLSDKAFAASLLAILVVGITVLMTGNEMHDTRTATAPSERIPRVTVTAKRLSAAEKRAMDQQERQQASDDNAPSQAASPAA